MLVKTYTNTNNKYILGPRLYTDLYTGRHQAVGSIQMVGNLNTAHSNSFYKYKVHLKLHIVILKSWTLLILTKLSLIFLQEKWRNIIWKIMEMENGKI